MGVSTNAGLEFAYSQSPRNMKSVVMALYLLTNAVGAFLGASLVQLVDELSEPHSWVPMNLNRGKLDMCVPCAHGGGPWPGHVLRGTSP